MLFFSSLQSVPDGFGPSAVTIGKFDGVHIGHRRVLTTLRDIAAERGLVSTVLTFDRNPLALLNPEAAPLPLSSNAQKRELLASTGIDATVMVPFTREFSALEPDEFVEKVLIEVLHARVVFVGADFRFGHRNRGDVALLTDLGSSLGFEVRLIDEVLADQDHVVSSTLVRNLLSEGRVREATRLLGRPPAVRGIVVHGQERGRAMGYPTANLSQSHEGFIPADGIYAARLTVDDRTMPAAVSVGNNPTFDGVPDKQVEAHVLDETLDLYERSVVIEFVDRIRPMLKFADVDGLIARMNDDERRIRNVLGMPVR